MCTYVIYVYFKYIEIIILCVSKDLWTTALENGIITFDRWSDQMHLLALETLNSRYVQNIHEGLHLGWEQLIDTWLQTKCTLQQYDLNFVVDALQSKIIYLTGNSCKLIT